LKRNWNENAKIQRCCYFPNSNHARSELQTRIDNEHSDQIVYSLKVKLFKNEVTFIKKTSQLTISAEAHQQWLYSKLYQFDRDRHFFSRVRWKFEKSKYLWFSFKFLSISFQNIFSQYIFFLNIATFKTFIGRIKKILTINVFHFHKYFFI
jgi:hypothetical protein